MRKRWIKRKPKKNLSFLLFFLIIFCLYGCFEPQEGCLNIQASNFDFDADRDCCDEESCCCEYPSLILDVVHKEFQDSSENFSLGQTYDWPIGDGEFIVENVRLYLSKFELHGNTQLNIRDSINITFQNTNGTEESKYVEDNFALIRPGVFSYNIGEIRASGAFDSLSMQFGVFPEANNAIPSSLPDGHPIAIQQPLMQLNPLQGYINCQVILKKDTFVTTMCDTLNIFSSEHIALDLLAPQIVRNGQDNVLKLRINYLEWFQGIDFALDNNDELISKVSNNLAPSIRHNE